MLSPLFEAYLDLKYLLNRGYKKNVALNFVANHYKLKKEDRYLLTRCVFSDKEIKAREKKRKPIDFIRNKVLAVDGFNVLITLESVLEGKAILCEDGLVRDLKYQRGYRLSEKTKEMLFFLLEFLSKFNPKEVILLYDKPISKSGEIAKLTNEIMKKVGLSGTAEATTSVDFELKKFQIVATSDLAVVDKVKYVVDIPQEFSKSKGIKIKELEEILRAGIEIY
ncbi:DUF434 domain-containing protein [Thermococcus paralvinellae]|uniref:DUF434 domain-containing protein n=1 Tax=Thermococcus paralvinellae TaxID=582419 RepID=W0IA50_9EURY|nr:DUF434 domain-containing protein [Thermococcus paralvinellae]AHF81313.1 Hypothetical protein TES1_1938 [Thermococcus paralvinellae]